MQNCLPTIINQQKQERTHNKNEKEDTVVIKNSQVKP